MTQASTFRIKAGDDPLTREDFDEWPAWSEHYDYDELEVIASWGVDRNWLAQRFKDLDLGGSHPHYTILDLKELPHDNMRIFLKATFAHPSGIKLHGYVMNADAFCICLFAAEKRFIFSRHPLLNSMMLSMKSEAEKALQLPNLFPLYYKTAFSDPAGQPIVGEFTI